MDAFLAIASKRDTRRYADRAVPAEVVQRVLEAGRVSGSARNRQPWRFILVESADRRGQLAGAVYAPENVRGAQTVIAIVSSGGMDTGRCAQNMMLAAWNDGVGACPNGIADRDAMAEAIGLREDDHFATVLTFGYPAHGKTGESRSVEEWLERADRKTLDELVERI